MSRKFFAKSILGVGLSALAFLAGCNNGVSDNDQNLTLMIQNTVGYGSLVISPNNSASSRAFDVSTIKFAKVFLSGDGISSDQSLQPSSDYETVTNGAVNSVVVNNIPAGKNRVVTVYAYDSSKEMLNPVVIRAVADIAAGKNTTVNVNNSTTALGNVFDALLKAGQKVSEIDRTRIESAINSSVHYSLIDSSKIANDYMEGNVKVASEYVLEEATLSYTSNFEEPVTIQVFDRISQVMTEVTGSGTLEGIAPGTYRVVALKDGKVLASTTVTFKPGKTSSVELGEIAITDKIIVHAKGYSVIYMWKDGTNGKDYEMTEEGNGWSSYTIEEKEMNMIFKHGSSWYGKTNDLSRTAGEYWFKDGKWYESNPEDSEKPVLESFVADKSGPVSGTVVFTVTATDNKNLKQAVIVKDGKILGTISVSGKNDSVEYPWSTGFESNGKHAVSCYVIDEAGNESDSIRLEFTTQNENLPPIAVIKGRQVAKTCAKKEYSAGDSYDQNGGTISAYEWTVTGATIVSGQGTSKINVQMPDNEGEVKISLVVKDDENASSESVSQTVKVREVSAASGDFRDETIYFLMTTRFYDGDKSNNEYCWDEGGEYLAFGDGDCGWRGDFKGLAEKLDYIKALGFSAIWITPVVENASGIDYHGYHAYDFSRVDPRYESTGFTYQDLIDACHAKGIKVIQDIVLNHTGNFGEKNIFHMFDKESVPYVNKDIPTPAGGKRSPFMKLAENGNAYDQLKKGLSMKGGSDYDNVNGEIQYAARINAMKEDTIDTDFIYHHAKMIDWNSENCQLGQMAGDCVDLNTENPVVFNYLKDCYTKYIEMGVDAFRIDTVKHISRLTFNKEFIPAFMEAGGENFYIFGETCARYRGRWNEGVPALSPSFYTWKEDKNFAWSDSDHKANSASATAHFGTYKSGFDHPAWADGIANHLLNGNDYHAPDWSMRSHLDQIDFPMHWAFSNADDAFRTAVSTNDPDFNDATWNVVYVNSHDYAPDGAPEDQRYAKTSEWPRNMNLMFTFRGIPCIYYGSEIEFMAGAPIDPANAKTSLDKSGRAYFGDYIEGNVTATDYGEYTASGKVAETLNHALAQHVRRLNQIRRAVPALRKGQYSTEGCNGAISFKRRYTNALEGVDSFVLVAIGGQASFSDVPAGKYVEVVTGKTVSCSGSLTSDSIGKDNMRVYVLKTSSCEIDGKIGENGAYLN